MVLPRLGFPPRAAVALAAVFALFLGAAAAASVRTVPPAPDGIPPVATFSIVAADTVNGELGVAVASRFLAVGSVVPWAEAGVGAVATQAIANTAFGPEGLRLLAAGQDAPHALNQLLGGDPQPEIRQVGMVDAGGHSATFTGGRCESWAGGIRGPGFAVQGNFLAGEDVVRDMADAFQNTKGSLAERLLAALQAGDKAGGDKRGKQAAALLVVKPRGGYRGGNDRYVDLRVDDAEDPVARLTRLYELHAKQFLPAVHVRLGDEALAAGRRAEAEKEFARVVHLYREAIADDPSDADAMNGLAWFFARHRVNLDEARTLALEARKLVPDSWQVLDTLAEISFARGDLRAALDYSEQALAAEPENPYLRGQAERMRAALDERENP